MHRRQNVHGSCSANEETVPHVQGKHKKIPFPLYLCACSLLFLEYSDVNVDGTVSLVRTEIAKNYLFTPK